MSTHATDQLSAVSAPPCAVPASDAAGWFKSEVQPHEPLLRSYLHGTYPDVGDVDDVLQESYLRIWKAKAEQPISSAKAFLFRVVRNLALDVVKRKRRSPITAIENLSALRVLDGKPSAADAACTREEVQLLAEAIHSMPARCREIIILRKLKRVSQKDIAAQLGISEKTVQVQVVRGVKRIGEILRAKGVRCPIDAEVESKRLPLSDE